MSVTEQQPPLSIFQPGIDTHSPPPVSKNRWETAGNLQAVVGFFHFPSSGNLFHRYKYPGEAWASGGVCLLGIKSWKDKLFSPRYAIHTGSTNNEPCFSFLSLPESKRHHCGGGPVEPALPGIGWPLKFQQKHLHPKGK